MDLEQLQEKYPTIKMANLRKGKGTTKNQVTVTCSCSKQFPCYTSDLWLRKCPKCEAKINKPKRGRKAVAK